MYGALTTRDLFLVTGCAMAGAIFLAAGNFVADMARALVDPRLTHGS
jgi:ABC-type dipeptide/oligopeptide/nickel transport system permease component